MKSGKAAVGSVRGGNGGDGRVGSGKPPGGDQGGVEGSVGGERGAVVWLAPRPDSWLSSRDGAVVFPLAIVNPLSAAGAVASSAASSEV